MSELILYNYFRSSTSYRVRIALNWKKLDFTYKPVHLLNNGGEQHTPEYKKISPLEEVPTLVHKINGQEKILAQSLPIMEYLDEVFPNDPILPKDSFERAKVRQFCENINSYLHPLSNLKLTQWLEKKHNYDQQQKNEWVNRWAPPGLAALETMISTSNTEYAMANQITMADICLAPQVFSARRFKVDLSPYPNILKLDKKYELIDAFKKAHPLRQIDTPAEEKLT